MPRPRWGRWLLYCSTQAAGPLFYPDFYRTTRYAYFGGLVVTLRGDDRFFVQTSETNDEGWRTVRVFRDRETAERQAGSFERSDRWLDGERASERSVLVARVISEEELLAEGGPEALRSALDATRNQP